MNRAKRSTPTVSVTTYLDSHPVPKLTLIHKPITHNYLRRFQVLDLPRQQAINPITSAVNLVTHSSLRSMFLLVGRVWQRVPFWRVSQSQTLLACGHWSRVSRPMSPNRFGTISPHGPTSEGRIFGSSAIFAFNSYMCFRCW